MIDKVEDLCIDSYSNKRRTSTEGLDIINKAKSTRIDDLKKDLSEWKAVHKTADPKLGKK